VVAASRRKEALTLRREAATTLSASPVRIIFRGRDNLSRACSAPSSRLLLATLFSLTCAFPVQGRDASKNTLDETPSRQVRQVSEQTADTHDFQSEFHLFLGTLGGLAVIKSLQPEKLHAWKRANRVERDPKRSTTPATPTPPAP